MLYVRERRVVDGHTFSLKDINRITLTKPSIFKMEIQQLLNVLALSRVSAASPDRLQSGGVCMCLLKLLGQHLLARYSLKGRCHMRDRERGRCLCVSGV